MPEWDTIPIVEAAFIATLLVEVFETALELLQRTELSKPSPPSVLLDVVSRVEQQEKRDELRSSSDDNEDETDKNDSGTPGSPSKSDKDAGESLVERLTSGYGAARAYALEKLSFGLASRSVDVAIFITYLSSGMLPLLWEAAADLLAVVPYEPISSMAQDEIPRSLVFLLLFQLQSVLLSAPISFFRQFVVEQRHGFNKMTVGLWVTDKLKSFTLTMLFGGPIAALVIWTVLWAGKDFPNYLLGLLFVVQIVAQVLVPTVIMPCFNKFEPLEDGPLKQRIETLAASLGFPLSKLSVMDGSKRSSHSNAFFMGLPGLPKRIVLFDTLLEQASNDEIVAVLAHELGHWKHNHTLAMQGLGLVLTYGQLWAFGKAMFFRPMYTAFGFADTPVAVGMLLFFTFAFTPINPILGFMLSAISRACEFDADAFAAAQGGKDGSPSTRGSAMARHLQTCLVKLGVENKSAQRSHWLYSAYHLTHPTLPERLSALQATTADADSKKTQ